jgi:hypothetical protein
MTIEGAGFAAIVVGPGTTKKVVPPMLTVLPCRPGGAWFSGIVVAAGITMDGAGFTATVVGPGTTRKVVPPMLTVLP